MRSPNAIVYRDIDASQALNHTIHRKLDKLNRFCDQINSSRVVLGTPHQHSNKGKLFRAQIELGIKGQPVILHQDNASLHIAVRDLFKAAERKLKEVSGKRADHGHEKPQLDLGEDLH
ncbi:30S ribosomal protein S30 [Pseudomaricurvus sp. HS19]|nr:HPF/RaiA family ribosome-associated protein [Pseudomaricurvus sp. HS19]MYM62310.1 30S ribosomal protein S30 [Pseudomaricurvus sp. HS19]